MDGATLQARYYKGLAIAAQKIGTAYHHYRPFGAANPISINNQLTDIQVSLNADDPTYARPNVYGKATWYAIMDGSQMQVGDYIVGIEGTLFVAAMQQLLPIFMVDCNRTVNVVRPQDQTGVGALAYGGNTAATETALMTQWPASILKGGKGQKVDMELPGDVKAPQWQVLLPYVAGVDLRYGDIINDDLGNRLVVGSAELTDLGWRIDAFQAET